MSKLKIVTLDAETYWDAEYSMSKLSPLEYVLDPRFELISMAIKVDDAPASVHFGLGPIREAMAQIDWSQAFCIGHNMSGFDAYILAYRLGIHPKVWGCTMAMARPLYAKTVGLALAKLVKHLGLGAKDNTILLNTRGKRLADFTPAELQAMGVYNIADTDQCYALFQKLRPHFSPAELWQIDALIRMRTEPVFELDAPLLETALTIERDQKRKALYALAKELEFVDCDIAVKDEDGTAEEVRKVLASAQQFSKLLERLGAEVPTKPSPTNPKVTIPALAKSDEAFLKLQEHPNPLVASAARCRLGVKSTLLETRIEKFLAAGRLAGGKLPIPLRYCGADTTGRDSGEEYNPHNLPRINPDKPKVTDALRRSLKAPEGHVVIVADQSGIELRVNHFLWQVEESMALYRQNPVADLYRAFGPTLFVDATPESLTKSQRQVCKIAQLGLGFGAGPSTFRRIAKTQAGIDIPLVAEGDALSCEMVVDRWRSKYRRIRDGWYRCHDMLPYIVRGSRVPVDPWGLVHTCAEGLRLPSGRIIRYPALREEIDEDTGSVDWWYAEGRHKARIYAGKITENIVQALARDSIFDATIEFYRRTGRRPALRVHDELVYVVPEKDAPRLLELLQSILRTPPKWWPELVVWSEGDVAGCYGDAK